MQSKMQEKFWKWTLKNLITDVEAERAEESRTYVLMEIEEKEAKDTNGGFGNCKISSDFPDSRYSKVLRRK